MAETKKSKLASIVDSFGGAILHNPIKITLLLLGLILVGLIIYWLADNWDAVKALGPIFTLGAKVTLLAVICAALLGITVTTLGIVYKVWKWSRGKAADAKAAADKKAEADKAAVDNDPSSTVEEKAAAAEAETSAKAANADVEATTNAAIDANVKSLTQNVDAATQNVAGGGNSNTVVPVAGPDGVGEIDVSEAVDGNEAAFDASLARAVDATGGVTGSSEPVEGGEGGGGVE